MCLENKLQFHVNSIHIKLINNLKEHRPQLLTNCEKITARNQLFTKHKNKESQNNYDFKCSR